MLVARNLTDFRARSLFHRVDQHRQPLPVALRRLPDVRSLAHHVN
jgi:hypothetical protein